MISRVVKKAYESYGSCNIFTSRCRSVHSLSRVSIGRAGNSLCMTLPVHRKVPVAVDSYESYGSCNVSRVVVDP